MSTSPPPLPVASFQPPPPAKGIPLPLIIIGVVVLCVIGIAMLAGLAAPGFVCMRKKAEQVVAMNNGRSLILALNDFNAEYGSFPDRETAKQVAARTQTPLDLTGDTANDYFRQLIAAGVAESEDPFYAKTSSSPKRPDNKMTGNEALKAGEVGFGYLLNGERAIGDDDPNRILAVTPLSRTGTSGQFDAQPFDHRAIVVRVDGSVKPEPLLEDGRLLLGRNKTLLDTGPNTIWGTAIKPVIKPPKTR
ncbi:MAG: hypothetical protein NTW21_33875 [Verrucomicrobia bacterium]|nr:hypothetical protein [Verrucomicrobiota bacterium]